ncbi:double-strand break repair protein AddB [Sphingobium sp. SYK-6]|uniref:double-strand break repair protein AddB n=1 Tax=Sphingobium sp. (strain NBRC 103272 / SYK-6) TaxID=627192 RepID=UPI00022775CF|nr:double-strand break repair protein AddB [Sphingobium sp. SYK-6]BAK66139.1 double-strand break repair protein AddB [Sphingobium sp. SYK-6]
MSERRAPALYTIPAHRAFSDALAAGLLARHGREGGGLRLARGIILLPNNRAVRAVRDAFVRASGSGLLLPRLVPVGDVDLDQTLGNALAPLGADAALPPAIGSTERLMMLARLVREQRAKAGERIEMGEAWRLAAALARTLDQLIVERKAPSDLKALEPDDLSSHWRSAFGAFEELMAAWQQALALRGCIDMAERRNRLLDHVAGRWRLAPPDRFVVAAGIVTSAPAVAGLLRVVSDLPDGMVVLPDLDLNLTPEQWDAIGPVMAPEPGRERTVPPQETHPQFALKLMLERMGVHRDEVALWRWGSEHDARAARGRAISNAMLPALLTGGWPKVPRGERALRDVRAIEAASPAEEAQAIAIALREAVETPGRTAALVTPDRALATRVSAHLRRWGIEADDSAGRPLAQLPPGTLLLALAQAGAERFAPVALLALLKHPLVMAGEGRLAWLEQVRRLDLLLRGPRPPAGLDGVAGLLAEEGGRREPLRAALRPWWPGVAAMLGGIETAFAAERPLPDLFAALRGAASALTGERVWSGHQGHSAARLIADAEAAAPHGPPTADPAGFVSMLAQIMTAEAVRPPQGGHPRVQILGLLEARLQQADLMILAGLNEGVWPGLPSPDPWLAPRIRHALGLPGLDYRIGLSAHDFANGLGAPQVILSRARRDSSAPTVASRFWLRLKAMTGERWVEDNRLIALARMIDRPVQAAPATPVPAPCPPVEVRPKEIAVTDVDRLRADPYAFYAARILRLSPLEPVDADPGPAWRGTRAHDVLQRWMEEGSGDPARLAALAQDMIAGAAAHPLLRALWQPRLLAGLDWVAAEVAAQRETGRTILFGERWGKIERGGVVLRGKPDRMDRLADGALAVVDYKSGATASVRQVEAGYSLQLGLLGLIAREGGFEEAAGVVRGTPVSAFEYWKLGKSAKGAFGYKRPLTDPRGTHRRIVTDAFLPMVERFFDEAAARWLTGGEPFTARPHSDAPVFTDYDQLMRLDEWFGRGGRPGGDDG